MAQEPGRTSGRVRRLAILLAVALVAACAVLVLPRVWRLLSPNGTTTPPATPLITVEGGAIVDEGEAHLGITLSPGQAQLQTPQPVPTAAGVPLSDEEVQRIFARLPSLTLAPEDRLEFRLPAESLPPPRTGETIEEPFPPLPVPTDPPLVDSGPLEVLRFAPEGEIPLAPFVNITFNQPMAPLTTLGQLAAQDVPVTLEPAVPGSWRWVGTKTLVFEADSAEIDRLPKATEYQVTVPAGTRSMVGGVLAQTVSWSFTTPPPVMTNYFPSYGPQPRDPMFFIAFDQRIDPAAVLETIEVTADGKIVHIQTLTAEELAADKQVSHMAESALEGRWLAFRAKELLPADAAIAVVVGPGTPSAEGPLVTTREQRFEFRTYAPLRIDDHGCSWGDNECRPLTPLYIRFNNPLDAQAFDEALLEIEPEIPGAIIENYGDTISIRGATKGSTTYRITVDGDIRDEFGQTLGQNARLTFRIGRAEPMLTGPDSVLVTLDPAAKEPVFTVYSVNYDRLEVKIYAVQPSDWQAFGKYLADSYQVDPTPIPPGRLVLDETLRVEAATDVLTEVDIELSRVMDGDYGHFIVIVQPPRNLLDPDRYIPIIRAWVQVTDIGLDVFVDHSQMLAWATALDDGAPLAGITLENSARVRVSTTAQDGTARFDIPSAGLDLLVARKGADAAMLPHSLYSYDPWQRRSVLDDLRWYVYDDRQMYRPAEEVHVKGWMRRVGGKQYGDVGLVGTAVTDVSYQVVDSQGNTIAQGSAKVNALGGFDFALTLPENANLGYAQIQFYAQGNTSGLGDTSFYHTFQIQEFRRPEFEVAARNETTGPYFVDGHTIVAVQAKYYAGGPLPNAEVNWQVTSSPSSYSPPNWPDFVFGTWQPWWWDYPIAEGFGPFGPGGQVDVETFSGVTDAAGEHFLRLDFDEGRGLRPFSVLAEATVFDVNRQAWGSTTSLLVHPADLYVGLRSQRTFVERGEPLEIDLIVTDLDGNPVADRPIEVRAARLEWKSRAGVWNEEEVDVQKCVVGSTLEPVHCSFKTDIGGRYQITAVVSDSSGRRNQSQLTVWVSGGERPPSRKVEQETVDLIPDQKSYQPGDVAKVLVLAPFSPAEGLLTVSRSGTLYTERFHMDESSLTLEIPIDAKHIPNLNIQVDLVGAAPRADDQGEVISGAPPRPAYSTGQLMLSVPPLQRTLTLKATPREKELEPGGSTILDLVLTDANGEPVAGAELAVVVVDEAVLALTNYQLADPVAVFYQNRPADLSSTYGRASIILVDPLALAAIAGGMGGGDLGAVQEAAMAPQATMSPSAEERGLDKARLRAEDVPIRLRTDFNPLATFAPEVRTDAAGQAQIQVLLPDNLTRYRVMVVAVDSGNRFGSAEANLTARLPLMVRPSAPRFLNFGDRFELPVVLQNQTDEPLAVEVVVQATNIELTGSAGLRVTVPARDRLEVRFPAAADRPGTARFQIAAVSGEYADAASVELPVYTPATTEAFAVYGVIDEGAVAQPVAAPQDVFPQFGELEITTSSTALQALTDAVIYLVSYQYECSEQLASRILAVAALRDVLTAFSAEGLPAPAEMEAAVARDLERLQGLQNGDGGFPYWTRGRESIPFNTIHVALAMQMAKAKGFEVPEPMESAVLQYLRDIESHYPSWYDLSTRRTLSAYALYVRDRLGDRDTIKARKLLNNEGLEALSLDAVGWLWQVLVDDPASSAELEAIRRHVNNRVVETAGAANFTTATSEQDYLLLRSDRRTDAILLEALIADGPESDLIPKVVNGLMAHRVRGRWGSTQENVFVLLALDQYFNTFEAQTPDFVARIWLGDTYAGEHAFAGRTTERHETGIPMSYLVDESVAGSTQDLILSKDGVGRLYYRLGLRYAPTDLDLDPLDQGFVVQRSYEGVDDPQDVRRDEDGVWHIKAGARVRVRITMVADNRRYHVALMDPLPAGLEIVNPALAVSGSVPQDPSSPDYRYGWWWRWTWYEHQNMRDQRAEAFTSLLWEGVYDYTYIARATTPGTFVVPPAKAEEMYSPEVFGRSSSDRVIVE